MVHTRFLDYRRTIKYPASFPDRYKRLHDLQIEVSQQGPGAENSALKYNGISLDVSFQLAALNNKLQAKYGSNNAVQAAQDEINAAESGLVRAGIENSSQSHAGSSTSNGPSQFGAPGFPADFPRTADEAFAKSLNEFQQRNGSDKTFQLHIKSELELFSEATEIVDKIMSGAPTDRGPNPKNFFASRRGNTTTIVFTYNGVVDEILAKIDFGRILSVDRQKREIFVDYNK